MQLKTHKASLKEALSNNLYILKNKIMELKGKIISVGATIISNWFMALAKSLR